MTERDELPEWLEVNRGNGGWVLWFRGYLLSGIPHPTRATAIAAAWRIADAEAANGR